MIADQFKARDGAIAITVHSFESTGDLDSLSGVQLILSLDKQKCAELSLDKPVTIPFSKTASQLQVMVRLKDSDMTSLGSISLSLPELGTLKAQSRKHWVTLFDDEDDNVYDGDYAEDDADVPRILLGYQLVPAAPETGVLKEEDKKAEVVPEKEKETVTPFDTTLVVTEPEKAESPEKLEAKEEEKLAPPSEDTTCHELVQTGAEKVVITCSVIPPATTPPTAKQSEDVVSPHFGAPEISSNACEETHAEVIPVATIEPIIVQEKPLESTNELITLLSDQNKKLRAELHGLEDEKSGILLKLQTEVQDYDEKVSGLLKEKYDLKERLAAAENRCSEADSKLGARIADMDREKARSEVETASRSRENSHKITQYETRIYELQRQVEGLKKTTEETDTSKTTCQVDMSEHIQKLETKYVEQLQMLQAKFGESEKQRTDLVSTLKEQGAKASEDAENIVRLNEEKENLRKECERLGNALKAAAKKAEETENKFENLERKTNSEVNDLAQKNMVLASKLEQSEQAVTLLSSQKESLAASLARKEQEISATSQQVSTLKSEADFLSSELDSRTKTWEIEKQTADANLVAALKKIEEIPVLQKSLQMAMLEKQKLEEELAEKCKVIKSLNDIIEQYKAELLAMRRKIELFEIEIVRLKREKEEIGTEHGNTVRVVGAYEERIKKITLDLTATSAKLQEKQRELAEKDTKTKASEEELESLKNMVKEQQTQISGYESQEKKRGERLDDIAQKTKETEKEIESLRLRSKTKEEKLQDASVKLMQKSKQLREVEAQCYQLQEELGIVKTSLKKSLEETEQLRKDLMMSRKEVDDLKGLLGTYKKLADEEDKEGHVIYTPDNTDRVDQMFAFYINETKCPVMLKKIGEGQYMFGTKKIFAKIQNEKLVIRVGGGYMMIDEFLSVYTAQELAKLQRMNESAAETEAPGNNSSAQKYTGSFVKGGKEVVVPSEEESDPSEKSAATTRKRSEDHRVFTKSTAEGTATSRRVPGGFGLRSKSPNGMINGTTRARVLTEQDVANARAVKNTVAKFEIKQMPKKSSTNAVPMAGEGENDSSVAQKQRRGEVA